MTSHLPRPAAVALAAWACGMAGGALPAAAVDLLSHRAAYRLSLAASHGAKSLTSVEGALVVEWRAECAGWVSKQQLAFTAQPEEGPRYGYEVRFTSWESRDDRRMRFSTRTFDDAKPGDEFEGEAMLGAAGRAGLVRYQHPDGQTLALPPETLFPTAQIRHLIEAAQGHATIQTSTVFDGSGPDALNKVAAVIGKARTPASVTDGTAALRWPVALAYYDVGKESELPQFEVAFELGADGVMHDLRLDYGNFALRGDLTDVEKLAVPSCR